MSSPNAPGYSSDLPLQRKQQQHEEMVDSTQSEFEETEESDADEDENGVVNAFPSSSTNNFPMLAMNNMNGSATNTIVSQGNFRISNPNLTINNQPQNDSNQSNSSLTTKSNNTSPTNSNGSTPIDLDHPSQVQDQDQEVLNETGLEAYFRRKALGIINQSAIDKVTKSPVRAVKNKSKSKRKTNSIIGSSNSSGSVDEENGMPSQLNDPDATTTTAAPPHQRRRELTAEERNYIYGINDGIVLLLQKCEEMHKKFEELLMSHKKLRSLRKTDIAELLKKLKPPRLSGNDLAQISGFKYETYKTTLRRRTTRLNGHTARRSGRRRKEDREPDEVNNDNQNNNVQ